MVKKTLNFKSQKKCRICRSTRLYKFLDLGSMPIPNGFLKKEELKNKEESYELACFYCRNCGLVQLTVVVDPTVMFKNYVYIPSTAKVMMNNFSNLAHDAMSYVKPRRLGLVVDVGSNDGSLLTFFKSYGMKVLGADPAENIAKVAELHGIPTEVCLFNLRSAKRIRKKYGRAKIITGTNVVAHIDDLHGVLRGADHLLDSDGIFVTEFPYLLDLIKKNEFDTIYHEHLSYFSLRPWLTLLEQYDFELIGVQRLQIHGGSIRLTHRRKKRANNPAKNTIKYLLSLENHYGLYDERAFDKFAERVDRLKERLREKLSSLKDQKKRIVGYGAAAKGNVLTNCFDIGTETLDYIVDSTPYKQGLFTPGKKIPVFAERKLLEEMPDYALILAWNFANEIMEKQKEFKKRGGRFIIPIPKVKVV